jgi:hypothetical protein
LLRIRDPALGPATTRSLRRVALWLSLWAAAACTTAPAVQAPSGEAAELSRAGDAAPEPAPERSGQTSDAIAADTRAPAAQVEEIVETTRVRVRSATEWLARSIDSWFGDVSPYDADRVTAGRVGLRMLWRQDDGWVFAGRFNVRLDLPNARETAYLLIGRDNERELVTDRPDAFSRQDRLLQERRGDQQFFVGLGLAVREALELRAGVRGGYKLYTQARYRHQWHPTERDRVEFRETVFWTIVDGFGSTTVLTYDRAYSPSLGLRWLTVGTLSEKADGFVWSSSLGLYRSFGGQRLLSLEALVDGEPSRVQVNEYGIRTRWEQPVYRDWLLGELIVGHFWPRRDAVTERGRSWAVGAGIQMRF